jgi:hypothetical protein
MLLLKSLPSSHAIPDERAWIVVEAFAGSYFVNGYSQGDGRTRATYCPPPFDCEQDALKAANAWATARNLSVVHVVGGAARRR